MAELTNWTNKGTIKEFREIGDYKWRAIFSDGLSIDINMVATAFPMLLYRLGVLGVEISDDALLQAQKFIDNWYNGKRTIK